MTLHVDTDIPAGNALIESVTGDTIRFRPDCRDTRSESWFYWNFRVRGCAGRRVRIESTVPDSMTVRGGAVSADGGWTWRWIDDYDPTVWAFEHDAGEDDELCFSLAMPYTMRNLNRWLEDQGRDRGVVIHELCRSRAGKAVPLLELGRSDGREDHQVLLTARHHCCEMMASYVLEGIMDQALAEDTIGATLRDRYRLLVVPFVDLDGVEAGDQGKFREPHDHNRDYIDQSIHPETAAIRELVLTRLDSRLHVGLDLHCPWVRGELNELIYLVGSADPDNAARQARLAEAIESHRRGPLPYRASGTLPHGQSWNVSAHYGEHVSFCRWMADHAPGSPTVATLETPYATAEGIEVNAESARVFGRDLACALAAL
ncbi:MAG: hypothetical protein JJU36_03610 [Phycisphaeraceae bacterium]|nr:hypothetical protein [Phycisphaeraceae bacterium]